MKPRVVPLLVLLASAGCGRIGFDATTGDDGDDGDAGRTDALDLPTGPWSSPQLITTIDTGSGREEATFTPDRLELIFRSGPGQAEDLFVSTRATTNDPWGAPTPIAELNAPGSETSPALSADGLTIWFDSDRSGNVDLWTASRGSRQSAWSAPVVIAALNTASGETGPMVDATGIYFNRQAVDIDIWHAAPGTPASPTNWQTPQPVTELDTIDLDATARTWAGGLRIVFNTTRTDGRYDLWQGERASLTQPFTNLAPISELDIADVDDWDMWVSDDGHYAIFGSGRTGAYELYEVTR